LAAAIPAGKVGEYEVYTMAFVTVCYRKYVIINNKK